MKNTRHLAIVLHKLALKSVLLIFFITFVCFVSGISLKTNAHAVSAQNFNASNIIDNSVFVNANSMSASQIQSFLISKVPTCDTNGSALATEYGSSLTHSQYAAAHGWPAAPYTCLRDYSENGIGAAQLIFNVSQQYQINPQVLIVLLQKEQGLVTDTWPLNTQYRSATGYGCPDTTVCNSQYYGFTNQITWAAKMYRSIMNQSPSWYSPYVLGSNFVQWSPNAACGGSTISISNLATVALYDYTPYQPNAAALAAGYGTGDACSSSGNRNFYLYFTDWFGSTTGPDNAWSVNTVGLYLDAAHTTPAPTRNGIYYLTKGQKVYLSITGTNIGRTTWISTTALLGTTNPYDHSSVFMSSDWLRPNRLAQSNEATIAPNGPISFTTTLTAPSLPGAYNETFDLVIEGVTWVTNSMVKLYIDVSSPAASPVSSINSLASTEGLLKGGFIISPEGNSVLKFQTDGNVVLYTNFIPVWSTGTSGSAASSFINQADGNLVLYDAAHNALWNSLTQTSGASVLKLQADGNLVLYSQSGIAVWNSSTSKSDQTNIINQALSTNNTLFPLQQLTTLDRKYRLTLQTDGNLVLYDANNIALWSSLTFGTDKGAYLRLQNDGNLVIYDAVDKALWAAKTSGALNGTLITQDDGNVVLYNSTAKPQWETGTFR